MSSTPKVKCLSSKQLDKTLSAKKKPIKTIKNILSSKSLEWPILENPSSLFEEMSNLGVNSNETNSGQLSKKEIRECMLFGFNQIGKSLKKDECGALLFDSNVPKILIAHLIYRANKQNIPTILIAGLQKFLLHNLGFKSSSLCFQSGNDKFTKLFKIIEKHNRNNSCTEIQCVDTTRIASEIKANAEPSDMICDLDKSAVVYLKRPDDGKRAFNPPSSRGNSVDIKPKVNSEMFIRLDEKKPKASNVKKSFNPLYIKRIQNNPERRSKKK